MWKVCQLLKGSRIHCSRPCNGGTLTRQQLDECENAYNFFLRPNPATISLLPPSLYRDEFRRPTLPIVQYLSSGQESINDDRDFDEKREHDRQNGRRQRRPGHEWRHDAQCWFNEFFGYTTVLAAALQFSRLTANLLPNQKRDDEDAEEQTPEHKWLDAVKGVLNGKVSQFLINVFWTRHDLWTRQCILPARSTAAVPEITNGASEQAFEAIATGSFNLAQDDSSSSSDVDSVLLPRLDSSSSYCDQSVQTDDRDLTNPFNVLMSSTGHRLAEVSRFSDSVVEHMIGVDLLRHGMHDAAIDYIRRAASSGNPSALFNLGFCYSRGYGVERDMSKAAEYWRAAADRGHALAKYQMGVCHARGLGRVAIDLDRSLRYMQAAASAGVPEAKTYLAAHEYKRGHVDSAIALLREAAREGDTNASALLSRLGKSEDVQRLRKPQDTDGHTVRVLPESSDSSNKPVPSGRFWMASSEECSEIDSDESNCWSPANSFNGRKNDPSFRKFWSDSERSSSVVFGESSESGNVNPALTSSSGSQLSALGATLKLCGLRHSVTAPNFQSYLYNFAMADNGKSLEE